MGVILLVGTPNVQNSGVFRDIAGALSYQSTEGR